MLTNHWWASSDIDLDSGGCWPDAARALRLPARVVPASRFQSCGSQRLAEIGLCVYDDEG